MVATATVATVLVIPTEAAVVGALVGALVHAVVFAVAALFRVIE